MKRGPWFLRFMQAVVFILCDDTFRDREVGNRKNNGLAVGVRCL